MDLKGLVWMEVISYQLFLVKNLMAISGLFGYCQLILIKLQM